MKTFVILFFFILLYSCGKDKTVVAAKDITGTWRWIYTYRDNPTIPDLTPQNTGIQELMIFYTNKSWKKVQNNITIDSGTYSLGHGHYLPYQGAHDNIYDSIVFYKNTVQQGWDAYKIFSNDTLAFGPGWAGRYSSYTLPYNGSKWWVKE